MHNGLYLLCKQGMSLDSRSLRQVCFRSCNSFPS